MISIRTTLAVALAALAAAALLVALPAASQAPQPPPQAAQQPSAPAADPALAGTWQPLSRALEPLGPLVLGEDSRIAWSICRGALAHRLDGEPGAVFAIEGTPGCVLSGQRITFLRLAPRAGGCDAEITLYSSAQALRTAQPEAWGLVERKGC